MLKTHIIIGMYNHLPEGASDATVEDAYQSCYRPFLSTLNRFPDVSAVLHFSGSLLKRLEARHPEFFMLLEELSGKRQIELLGGAFYAPILPMIPNSDRLGQLELLTTYLRKNFGKRSRGAWLNEYAWEPWLASTFQTCGLDYTFLLEDQFTRAAVSNPNGLPVITEDQGRSVTVFPVYDCMHSGTDIAGYEQIAESLAAQAGRQLATIMLPGEALRQLWERSGLESPDVLMERCFAWFRRNSLTIETTTPGRFLKNRRLGGRAYFPGFASQHFMRAINPESGRGNPISVGSLRRALVAHPCAKTLYSKMTFVHILIGQLRGDKARKKNAAEDLWKGQCADAFWLAPSGGLSDPAIRQAAWKGLLEAEQTTRQKSSFKPGIIYADIDFDGEKEFLYQGADLNAYIHGNEAAIFILEAIKARRNLCDVYLRDPTLSEQASRMFSDYLLPAGNQAFATPAERRCSLNIYSHDSSEKALDRLVFNADNRFLPAPFSSGLRLLKKFQFSKKKISCCYQIQNGSDQPISGNFLVQLNCAILPEELEGIQLDDSSYPNTASAEPGLRGIMGKAMTVSSLVVQAAEAGLTMQLEASDETLFQILALGEAEAPQGHQLNFCWPIALAAGEQVEHKLSLQLD